MKFKIEWLQDTNHDENDVVNVISCRTRWGITYDRVFKYEGRYYRAGYQTGATEYQDVTPYQYGYDEDELECKEVFPVLKTITVYE